MGERHWGGEVQQKERERRYRRIGEKKSKLWFIVGGRDWGFGQELKKKKRREERTGASQERFQYLAAAKSAACACKAITGGTKRLDLGTRKKKTTRGGQRMAVQQYR